MRKLLLCIRCLLFLPVKLLNVIQFRMSGVSVRGLRLIGLVVLSNAGKLTIGKNTKINSSKMKNVIGGATRTSFVVRKGAELRIGKEVKISNSAFYASESITVGDYVMIGGSCKFWDTDFHSLDWRVRRATPNEGATTAPIVIENDVFIGGGSTILKGVHIGARSIVAAGSVVSKSIPADEVWGGNPAQLIRKIND